MKIKVSKYKFNPLGEVLHEVHVSKLNSATRMLLTLCTFPTH